jgi:hypothetical protein
LALGDDVGLGILAILVGLVGVGFGLQRHTAVSAFFAIGGWMIFLVGVLRILVPGFFA